MATITVDIKGKVNNTSLPDSKYLWALLEAVVNSIQAIEESPISNGHIDIYAQRLTAEQTKFDVMEANVKGEEPKIEIMPFDSFTITDNGCGFTEENYKSFCTSESSLKWKKGCKGIGRFLWLKAFESVNIQSNFQEDGKWKKRIFNFTFDGVLPDDNISDSDMIENTTSVLLSIFKNPYRNKCPKTLEVLARKIIEHCLIYFILDKCPQITLRDNLGDCINLNSLYESSVRDSLHQDPFALNGKDFIVYHVQMPDGANSHELHFCANDREVRSIKLDKFFPNLQRKITNNAGESFFYCGYLTGTYLDANVNNSRTAFEFDDKAQIELGKDVSEKNLVDAAKEYVSAYLKEYIDEIDARKAKRINDFVSHKQPQYRLLLNQRPDTIANIKPELSDSELELALYSEVLKWDTDAKQRGVDIKRNMAANGVTDDEFAPRFEAYCKEITAISKISLSEYIIRRRVILDLLEVALEKQDDGTYVNEDEIHSIICPMRYTSDEINFEEMNLWIINERLVYHNFLASDKQMRELPVIDSSSQKRMDIAIFDEAFAFSDKDNPFNSITIIEFKKPYRNDLNRKDTDPIDQVLGYVEDIKDGKKTRAKGRPFGNVKNAAFYCYVIADLTDSMMKSAKKATLTITPDGEGFFGYNQNYGTYIEVISYNKLLKDAKERNQVLFDKLFKPSPREIMSKDTDNPATSNDETPEN